MCRGRDRPSPFVVVTTTAPGAASTITPRGGLLSIARRALVARPFQLKAVLRGVGVHLVKGTEWSVVLARPDELGSVLEHGGPVQAVAESFTRERAR